METSRDDFVIAIRSAFLKKGNKQRFSLIVLIFFSFAFLILGKLNFKAIDYVKIAIKEIVYRSSFIISTPENYAKDTIRNVKEHFIVYEDYLKVKKELADLKTTQKVNDYIISENKRLKKVIDDLVVSSEEIIAKVLVDKQSPFLRSIVINKGSQENVKLGMAVLDNSYLVGKVVEVNYLTSRILLLSDLNSKIPINVEPNGVQSILSGTGKQNGIIQYIKDNYDIAEGSIVYTSGSGGLFKSGIPIGKIANTVLENEKYVDFYSDFSQLRFVKIVSFENMRD
jgi:rod shape-determining protein MreC